MKSHLIPQKEELIRTPQAREFAQLRGELPSNLHGHKTQGHGHQQTFGPFEPAFDFPLLLKLGIEGRRITWIDPEIGWAHQGIEKTFESTPWQDCPKLFGRVNPFGPSPLTIAFCLTTEEMIGISDKVPRFAKLWRLASIESSRVHQHLIIASKISTSCAPIHSASVFEELLKMSAFLSQVMAHADDKSTMFVIGGLKQANFAKKIDLFEKCLNKLKANFTQSRRRISNTIRLTQRLSGIGRIDKKTAMSFGLTGPALRACGIGADLRGKCPELGYDFIEFKTAVRQAGDGWARFSVRLEEVSISLDILSEVLSIIKSEPYTDLAVQLPRALFSSFIEGANCVPVEGPDGEIRLSIVSDGGAYPFRMRIQTPSFMLSSALVTLLKDADIDDVVLILDGLGICGYELDR